jgi:hypothetical protein
MTEQQARDRASKIVRFLYQFLLFIIVNLFLYFLDFKADGYIDWAYWVTIGWGFAIVTQFFHVYFGPSLEDKIAKNILEK